MRFASTGLRAGSRQRRSIDGRAVNGSAGFTLLETLTALTILAIALVSLFDSQARGLRAAGAADSYAEARILAQALLADTVSGWSGTPIPRNGSDGRFGWSIDVTPEHAAWAEIKSKTNWRPYHIRVTVAWDKDRSVTLDTVKLGRSNESNE
jgi:prepilin-type N-terminal cleavage/methylation domain-containing protein